MMRDCKPTTDMIAAIKRAASKVHGQFVSVPGYYLDWGDLRSVGYCALAAMPCAQARQAPLVYTICYRRMVDYARSCTPLSRSILPVQIESISDRHEVPDAGISPERAAIYADVRRALLDNRFGLSEANLDAMRLVFVDGLSQAEAAHQLNITAGAMSMRVTAAVKKVRRRLKLSSAPLAVRS